MQFHIRPLGLALAALLAPIAAASDDVPGRPIDALLARDPGLDHDPATILVGFAPELPGPARENVLALVGGRVLRSYTLVPGLHEVEVSIGADQALAALEGLPFVEYAQPNHILRATGVPNDPRFVDQWGLNNTGQLINGSSGLAGADIDAPQAWNFYTGNPNFAVAIIDNGVAYTHPDLAANIWVNSGEIPSNGLDDDGNGFIDDIRGWDWVDDDNTPSGPDGHGTRNAGLVGAVGNNALGISGVAWRCKIVCLRFLGPQGGLESDIIAALQYCVIEKIKVSNNSWSAGPNYSQALYNAINAARIAGHLFVCGAANGGKDLDNAGPDYPSSFTLNNIISVAATTDKDARWANSNYGAISVDLAAPGVKILSTTLNSGYNYGNGTSFAAPHVAGVAALVWGKNPAWNYAQVRNRIFTSVRPIPALAGKTVTGGIVNAAAAVAGLVPPAAPTGLNAVNLGGGKARLTWMDNAFNETKYQIQRQVHSGGVWTGTMLIDLGANVTVYTDAPGPGLFRYHVRARNPYGNSAWTPWKNVTVN